MKTRHASLSAIVAAMIFVLLMASSLTANADTAVERCRDKGYTISAINGVFTDEEGARNNQRFLAIKLGDTYKGEPIDYQYFLNPSHLAGVGDIAKSIKQGLFDSETIEDYDLVEMLQDASEKVATQKLLLVAHSQGNFYANSFYDTVADKTGGAPAESIGVYGVATPSSRVAGGGKWLTSDTDKAIAGIVGHIPFRKIMEPNTHIKLQSGDDFWGHSFSGIYLNYQGDKIISDIKSSFDRLKTNNIQDAQKPCLAPPEISIVHKIQGNAFAAADFVANGVSFVAFKLPTAVVKAAAEKVVEVAQAVKEAFSNVFQKDRFQLAQIIDLAQSKTSSTENFSQNSQNQQINQENLKNQQSTSIDCSFGNSQSASHQKVIINEVAWMGGVNGANDEWIELKNISNSSLDISGYQLIDQNGKIKIVFESGSKISAGEFYLLERADDNTVPGITDDIIYSGVLTNTGNGLQLFDSQCNLIDEVLVNPDWPAGDNATKKTMERSSDLTWYTSTMVGGTPKKENSQPELTQKIPLS